MTKSKNKIIVFVCIILFFLSLGFVLRYFLSTQKTSANINNNIITNQDINESISVAYSTDQYYIYPTIVSMTSLMENLNKNTVCKFTVLVSGEIPQEEIEKLKTLEKNYKNCSVNIIDMGEQYNNSEIRCWSKAMYYRLCLPEILKQDPKCIYVDGDTIIRQDLNEMFNINLDNYYIAGIRDINSLINKNSSHHKTIGIPDLNTYVCSGVLIMNLEKMRQDKICEKFDEIVKQNDEKPFLHFPDMDILNKVCYGHILCLPFKYGALAHAILEYTQPADKNEYVQWASNPKDWSEGSTNPVILHYIGQKPWTHIKSDLYLEWWNYADKTDFKTEIHNSYNGLKNYYNQ